MTFKFCLAILQCIIHTCLKGCAISLKNLLQIYKLGKDKEQISITTQLIRVMLASKATKWCCTTDTHSGEGEGEECVVGV